MLGVQEMDIRTLQATKTAVIIARYSNGSQQLLKANKGIYVMAEYLESLGM